MPIATLPSYRIEPADWSIHGCELRAIRKAIFVSELGGADSQEWNRKDTRTNHLLVRAGDPAVAIGALRWQPSGQIEYLAVLPEWRGRGIGRALIACAVRELNNRHARPWLFSPASTQIFFQRLGFTSAEDHEEQDGQIDQRMVLQDPEALIPADLGSRLLGHTNGRIFINQSNHLALASRQLASQALRQIDLLSAVLQPGVYAQDGFVEAVRYLALERRGRLPVRILVIDPEPAMRYGHRLIDLARQLSSDVHIRLVPTDWAERCDQFLLCDQDGYCLTRMKSPQRTVVDFSHRGETRRLRRLFEQIWEQGESHPGLRRLYL